MIHNKSLIDSLKPIIEAIEESSKNAIDLYSPIVDDLIQSKCLDYNKIESTLDCMLGFCNNSDMLILYKKLCRYYYTINTQGTIDYIRFYREMWEDLPQD